MSISVILDNTATFRKQATYVFDTIFQVMGVSCHIINSDEQFNPQGIVVYYGNHPERFSHVHVAIPEDTDLMTGHEYPEFFFDKDVPALSSTHFKRQLPLSGEITKTNLVDFDMIASAFFLLSRKEERLNKKRDQWGCFSAYQSTSSKWHILEMPVVNTYIERLLKRLKEIGEKIGLSVIPAARWPGGKPFAVVLTHDVDNPPKYAFSRCLKNMAKSCLCGGTGLNKSIKLLYDSFSRRKDPYWSFSDFIDMERRFGAKSTFYVISDSTNGRYDPYYKLKGRLTQHLRSVLADGWEVGLHGSYDSYLDGNMLIFQKRSLEKAIDKKITGLRQHYLRICTDMTYRVQSHADFIYDTSLGYNEEIGFRAGLAAPFFPYDHDMCGPFRILELPLAVMDGSLFEFAKLDGDGAIQRIKEIIDNTEKVGGMLVVLWHMKARDVEDQPEWWTTYEKILKYAYGKNAWITSAGRMADWWITRVGDVRNMRID